MKNKSRIEKLEAKVNVAEINILCICKFYSDYKDCNCKEAYTKIKTEGRTPTMEDFYKIHTCVV